MTSFLGVDPAIVALGLLLLLFIAFTIEKYPPEVTAAGGAALFFLLGMPPADEVMSVFSSSAPITIAAMFVVSGALVRTGVLDSLAGLVIENRGGSLWLAGDAPGYADYLLGPLVAYATMTEDGGALMAVFGGLPYLLGGIVLAFRLVRE